MQNNIQNIFLLGNDQLMFVSGGGTIKRIAQGVFEGVAISVLSGLVLAEGKNLMSDISLNDNAWDEKKKKHASNAFIENFKCVGGPLKAASGAYYKAHNKVVDFARKPWWSSNKDK